jgi:molybdopterin-guanine dinucleotide biosynthesis protein B
MDTGQPPRFPDDPTIIAVASDRPLDPVRYGRPDLPALPLNDVETVAGFVAGWLADSIERIEPT